MSSAAGIAAAIINNASALTSTSAVDVTGVFDQNYNQLFVGARPISAKITPVAKMMTHPLEDGTSIADHRVIMPVDIQLSVILDPDDYVDTYNAIKSVFNGISSVTVQTRVDSYPNMYICEMPHDETAAVFDTVTMILKLSQALIATSATIIATPADPTNSATVSNGNQQGTTQAAPGGGNNTGTTGSAAYGWFYGNK